MPYEEPSKAEKGYDSHGDRDKPIPALGYTTEGVTALFRAAVLPGVWPSGCA